MRSKILYLIQAWAHAFRNEPKYKVVQDTYQIMKVEGEDRGQSGADKWPAALEEPRRRRIGCQVLPGVSQI